RVAVSAAAMRAGPAAVTPAALAALAALLALLAADCAAYNEDRPIYKWSPVWFNRYFRTANAIKRVRHAPGPGEQCVTYGRRCSYWGIRLPCCEADAKCLMEHCVPLADQYLFLPED
ncbi:uncharacterized protein GBIM_09708, partial [Gryllus bimaculatus]